MLLKRRFAQQTTTTQGKVVYGINSRVHMLVLKMIVVVGVIRTDDKNRVCVRCFRSIALSFVLFVCFVFFYYIID